MAARGRLSYAIGISCWPYDSWLPRLPPCDGAGAAIQSWPSSASWAAGSRTTTRYVITSPRSRSVFGPRWPARLRRPP